MTAAHSCNPSAHMNRNEQQQLTNCSDPRLAAVCVCASSREQWRWNFRSLTIFLSIPFEQCVLLAHSATGRPIEASCWWKIKKKKRKTISGKSDNKRHTANALALRHTVPYAQMGWHSKTENYKSRCRRQLSVDFYCVRRPRWMCVRFWLAFFHCSCVSSAIEDNARTHTWSWRKNPHCGVAASKSKWCMLLFWEGCALVDDDVAHTHTFLAQRCSMHKRAKSILFHFYWRAISLPIRPEVNWLFLCTISHLSFSFHRIEEDSMDERWRWARTHTHTHTCCRLSRASHRSVDCTKTSSRSRTKTKSF